MQLMSTKENSLDARYYANFAVFKSRHFKYVYVIFYGGHVNCTNIPCSKLINDAVKAFELHFCSVISNVRIQAIAATYSNALLAFDPDEILVMRKKLPSDSKLYITSSRFAGVRIRFHSGGTAQLFFSGRANFLGAKNIEHLIRMHSVILSLAKEKACAVAGKI